jgi:hypothetical protein
MKTMKTTTKRMGIKMFYANGKTETRSKAKLKKSALAVTTIGGAIAYAASQFFNPFPVAAAPTQQAAANSVGKIATTPPPQGGRPLSKAEQAAEDARIAAEKAAAEKEAARIAAEEAAKKAAAEKAEADRLAEAAKKATAAEKAAADKAAADARIAAEEAAKNADTAQKAYDDILSPVAQGPIIEIEASNGVTVSIAASKLDAIREQLNGGTAYPDYGVGVNSKEGPGPVLYDSEGNAYWTTKSEHAALMKLAEAASQVQQSAPVQPDITLSDGTVYDLRG